MTGRIIHVDPDTLATAAKGAKPGDTLILRAGTFSRPLELSKLRGTQAAPITLRGEAGAMIDGGRRFADFQLEANREARRVDEELDMYPGLYLIADHAQWKFAQCEWLRIENLAFRGCWPTCIYINDCLGLSFAHLNIEEGTFAFYATGTRTQNLLIEHCRWVQDVSPAHDLWATIGWKKVHDDETPVQDSDSRAYDGDFFRAYAIRGAVTIRDNTISDAFNGVHIFNDEKSPSTSLNRDVWIYRNTFIRIRDNPIEPEFGAFNWWVFQNTFYNCHAWFSMELGVATHFYVFGNVGWFDDMPGPISDDTFGGGVLKLDKKKMSTANPGPHYFFNNSWYLRSAYSKNGAITRLRHFNNAVQYCDPASHGTHEGVAICNPTRPMFWESGPVPDAKAFTRDWRAFDIEFKNDMIAHRDFPAGLISAGYAVTDGLPGLPGFAVAAKGRFKLEHNAPARGKGISAVIKRPKPLADWILPAGLDLGAYQGEDYLGPPADFSALSAPDVEMNALLAEAVGTSKLALRSRRPTQFA